MATKPAYRLITADEFLLINFGEQRAELDRGVIRMMAGGSRRHSRVAGNIYRALGNRLEGGPCAAHGPDMAIRTRPDSVRYPDVSVLCGRETEDHDRDLADEEPTVLVEVLSPGTREEDLTDKYEEYRLLGSVDTVIFVDIEKERVRVLQRTGAKRWDYDDHDEPFDVPLPALGITLPHAEIFAR